MLKQVNASEERSGLLPTPALPADLPPVSLTDNARQVLVRRYVRRGKDGQPVETVEEMFWRVAYHIALSETAWCEDVLPRARQFYELLTSKRFFPNSPTFTGAGTPLGQLAACFVLPISDDMGRDPAGIFQTLRDAALIQQTGGGNGFSFSRLRPKGALVKSSAGQATGPVGFLRVYDKAFGEIAQGGCLLPDTLVFTEQGLLRLDEIVDAQTPGWQPHALQIATDEGWRSSPRGYNNGVAPVLRLHTSQGIRLAGTPEHRVKVMTSEGPQWRTLKDLRPGDWILVALGQHRGRLQALRQPVPGHGNQAWPVLPKMLDEEFAFFLGYLAGDGFVASGGDDHRLGVSVSHTSYLVKEMPELLQRLFGVTVHHQQKPNDRSLTLVIDNRTVKEFLQINGLTKPRSREAFVPRLIRQSPPEVVGAYLRGLFEADGTLSQGYPVLMTSSPRLAEEVASLLIGLGCPVRIRSVSPGVSHYGSLNIYHVRIESSAGLESWRMRIGCDPRSRFVGCYAWEADSRRESAYVLPEAAYWLRPVLDAITLEQIDAKKRGQNKNFRSTQPGLRRSLLRYLRGERQLTRSGFDDLARRFPEFAQHARDPQNLWFVSVSAVEDSGQALTLDLEVDGNHTYLANGMVTHNTRRGANMAVLRVDHPDIEEFITCKTDENAITNFNISVGITDAFMEAVRQDAGWQLRFPDLEDPRYKGFRGTLEQAEAAGLPIRGYKTVRARELFDKIVSQAHHNGEPGVLFLDAANRSNPVPHLYQLEATNPCFVANTRIPTEYGLLTIAELAQNDLHGYIAADNRAQVEGLPSAQNGVALRPASPAWLTRRNAPVFTLTTRMGYQVTATADHRFLTPNGYVALQQLRPGDVLFLQSGEGPWSRETRLPNQEALIEKMAVMALSGDHKTAHTVQRADFQQLYAGLPTHWSHELGLVMGYLVGDGWLSETSNSPLGMVFSSDDVFEMVHNALAEWFGPGHVHQRGKMRQLTYGRLPYEFFRSLGVASVRSPEKRLPDSIWTAPRVTVVGFLQGLFSADGSTQVNWNKQDCTVRLASSSRGLLQDVQIILSNFGILSRVYTRRPAGYKAMPDGKGSQAKYAYRAQYELVIGKSNRDRFASLIGFADDQKQARLHEFISAKKRRSNVEPFTDLVARIQPAGSADVYDLSQPQTNSLIANGFVAHNCGEQFLGPYENCCLGSVNLAQHFGPQGTVDWEKLRQSVELSTIFLDDVVDANAYVPAVPQLAEAARRARRIGLGIMGLADLMYHVGVRYGSPEGQEFAAQVMEFIRYHSMQTSILLAEQRGPFPAILGSIYDPQDMKWHPPQPITPHSRDWGRPAIDWAQIESGVRSHGIRNAAQTTIAPTGTIATVAGCEGYGCEPVFALAYIRHVNDNGKDLKLTYASPSFEKVLVEAGIDPQRRQTIVDHVMEKGTCQGLEEVPQAIRDVFVVSQDITAEEHVRLQAALQAFVDNSLSKTVNFPETAVEADVATAYQLAWEQGCKGITVYVTGSRHKVVLETKATARQKGEIVEPPPAPASAPQQLPIWHDKKKPRPRRLVGHTISVETPLGKAFVTVNENGGSQPFEVFVNTSKAGSDTAAVSEAIGRLISYILRLASPIAPRDRLKEVWRQLSGIGGGRSLGFGPNRVRSLPDGVAQALAEYLENSTAEVEEAYDPEHSTGGNGFKMMHETALQSAGEADAGPAFQPHKIGDLCPECGQASVVNEEGCRKCYTCGFSEC